jgi:tetratricopeptide (TPR) repeat protein
VSRAIRIFGVGTLAVGLIAGGAVLAERHPSPRRAAATREAPVFLAPGGRGGLDGAIDTLQARLRVRPDARSYAELGLAYLQRGRLTADPSYYPKAEMALRRSLALGGARFESSLGLGVLALGRHDFAGALGWGRRAHEENAYSSEALGVVGDALVELGRYPAAARAFQLMVDVRPSLFSYARVSYIRELHGDVRGAEAAMAEALDLAGTPEDAAWAGYQLGELRFGQGRVGSGARAYRRAAAVSPGSVLPRIGLARVAAARHHVPRAIRILERAVERYPAPEVVILLGDLQASAGDREAAEATYDLVRAMDELFRAGGVDTDLEMAVFAADHGIRRDEALRRARDAYARRPSVQAADALAWTLYANGLYREAARYSEEARRLNTRSALFRFHAGMIASRLGREAEARRELAAALTINPHFSFLHAATARRELRRLGRR